MLSRDFTLVSVEDRQRYAAAMHFSNLLEMACLTSLGYLADKMMWLRVGIWRDMNISISRPHAIVHQVLILANS